MFPLSDQTNQPQRLGSPAIASRLHDLLRTLHHEGGDRDQERQQERAAVEHEHDDVMDRRQDNERGGAALEHEDDDVVDVPEPKSVPARECAGLGARKLGGPRARWCRCPRARDNVASVAVHCGEAAIGTQERENNTAGN